MHQRRTGLLALLVIVTLAVAAWWLWNLDAGGTPRANEEATADLPALQPRREKPRVDVPATEPAKPAPETPTQPEGKPKANPEAAAYDEPAQIPVYGDLLKRGGAVITFDLRDAQGQWLINEPVTTRLIRKLGRYSLEEDCYWSFDDGTVVCDGESSAGLEPGTYELEVDARNYGWLRHTFTVQRGEKAKHELRLPYWRRIVTCHFNDLQGNPLPFLMATPSVATTKPAGPTWVDTFSPRDVMRNPPTPSGMGGGGGRGGKGGFAYRRARGGGGNRVFVTDAGKWYFAVFSGANNKISAEGPGEAWPGENLEIAGTFDGAADATVEFRLNAPADLDVRYANYARMGTDDPGQRSLLDWAARKGVILPADDPADVFSGARLVLELTGDGFTPLVGIITKLEDGADADVPLTWAPMKRRGGLWYTSGQIGDECMLKLSDPCGNFTRPERLRIETRITRISRTSPAAEPLVHWPLGPTLDAWALHREISLSPVQGESQDWLLRVDAVRRPALTNWHEPLQAAQAQQVTVTWKVAHKADHKLDNRSQFWDYRWMELAASSDLAGREALLQLDTGTLQPTAPRSGLYFRAVDPWGAGLPWVEATLHTLEDDARAQRLRDLERRGHKDGWRPNLSTSFANARFEDPSGLSDDDLKRERVRGFVGEDFERECKDDADLKFYLRTGAWYDSYTRLRGGEYGYHIDLERKLTPGKKYVLYLWSNSRDDLHPDARIVFQAAEVTDLGLITLPAYTE